MKFLRCLLEITKLDKEKNQWIWEKTGAQNIVKEIKQYQKKWQHVQRMDTNRIPKQALQYRPKGRRNIGWPKKWWRNQFHFEDQGTENRPNPSWTWWWWWWWWNTNVLVICNGDSSLRSRNRLHTYYLDKPHIASLKVQRGYFKRNSLLKLVIVTPCYVLQLQHSRTSFVGVALVPDSSKESGIPVG